MESLGNLWPYFHSRSLGWGQNDLHALMTSSRMTTLAPGTTPDTSNQKRISVKWRCTNLLIQCPEEGMENNGVQRKQVRILSLYDWYPALLYTSLLCSPLFHEQLWLYSFPCAADRASVCPEGTTDRALLDALDGTGYSILKRICRI